MNVQWKLSKNLENNPLQRKILEIKRVTRVTGRGSRFGFTALVLLKNLEKNTISFAKAKGNEVRTAIQKAARKAEKKLVTYFPKPIRTISHDIKVKFKATKIFFKPAPVGAGVKAGSVLNDFFKFLNVKDVSAKIITGSKNKLNIIQAAFKALEKLTGKKINC